MRGGVVPTIGPRLFRVRRHSGDQTRDTNAYCSLTLKSLLLALYSLEGPLVRLKSRVEYEFALVFGACDGHCG